ncbi:hypothetical protein DFS34DRAFT_637122 [Phlyctochytrium arcticum]|nr:hypothetical protein DFS34DRAFT_637122 [Phlyctochytrium arcticum]
MPTTLSLPKPATEPSRPQRRHYLEVQTVYDSEEDMAEMKKAECSCSANVNEKLPQQASHSGATTYRADFSAELKPIAATPIRYVPKVQGWQSPKTIENMYQRALRDATFLNQAPDRPEKMAREAEVNKYAFMSSYQRACKDALSLPAIPSTPPGQSSNVARNPHGSRPSAQDHTRSLQRQHQLPQEMQSASPPHPPIVADHSLAGQEQSDAQQSTSTICEMITNPWGKTKLLYVPNMEGASVRNLMRWDGKEGAASKRTSYSYDYPNWPHLQIGQAAPVGTIQARPYVAKAMKYRRWGGWAGGV